MSFPVRFGAVQIGLFLLILIGLALLVWAVLAVRRSKPRAAIGRGLPGLVVLLVAVVLLWIATLLQTYLGLSGEIRAARVVATPVAGQQHRLDIELTLFDGDEITDRSTFQVEGDLWVLQADLVELHPWVNALGFHSGYRVSRLYGQRLDGAPVTQHQIMLAGDDRDFFTDMNEKRWYTNPFVRSAYGNAVIATPGEYDVFISHDAIKTRAV
ncbi:hypothetical protein ACWEVD_05755 [Nocardia thailandica]|uniref:hypothetical protein n=1 Tax=Nocardia thailandica TaxID=257275 RepID=UPI0002E2A447|nr:hypothetical protein [Nocardia thailandica]